MNPDAPKVPYILAIASSPSKGFNSDSMLDAFIEGAKSADVNPTIEKLYLYDLNIPYYEFARRVPLDTPEEHDIKMVADKIMGAQGLVIATPTWNFGVPGKLKNLFDRLGYVGLDYKKMNWLSQPTGQFTHLHTFFPLAPYHPLLKKLLFPIFPPLWLSVAFLYYGGKLGGSIFGGGLGGAHTSKSDLRLMARCREAGVRFAKKIS